MGGAAKLVSQWFKATRKDILIPRSENSTIISKAHACKGAFMMSKQEPQNKQPWINMSKIHPTWIQVFPSEQSVTYLSNLPGNNLLNLLTQITITN